MTSIVRPDYWSLLGINPGSDQAELKRAFRREARKWHPDLNIDNSEAEERFKLINEAYAVLSDPRKKAAWEKLKQQENCYQDPFSEGFPTFEEYISVVLGLNQTPENEDFFDDSYEDFTQYDEYSEEYKENNWPTASPIPTTPVKALDDLETVLHLDPDQALNGTLVEIELSEGTVVEVQTPPFSGDGWRLRLPGVAAGGRDHFLQLRVQTEDGLRIDGLKVFYKLELFPPDAVLGCAVDVPTLFGPVTLQVPPRSSSGRILRLRSRGLEYDGIKGDQLVEIAVVIPAEIRDGELALYQRLQELSLDEDSSVF